MTHSGERICTKCGISKHLSRFRSFRETNTFHGSYVRFSPKCRDCEQIERNENKNVDRALALIRQRAAQYAHEAGVSASFFMVEMNWQGLVEEIRPKLEKGAKCLTCAHPFRNVPDIQLEHREPPRHPQDWARQHARNMAIACSSCNRTKRNKQYTQWLDEQEEARQSNELHNSRLQPPPDDPPQKDLFA